MNTLGTRIFLFFAGTAWSLMCFYLCRCYSIFFDEAKCQIGFRIKSNALCCILIASETKIPGGRFKGAEFHNANKISLVGLLAHLIIDPICIITICLFTVNLFFPFHNIQFLGALLVGSLSFVMVFFAIIDTINNRNVR